MNYKLRPWTDNDVKSAFHNADNADIYMFMSDGFPNTIDKWKSFIEFTLNNDSILYLAIEINGQAVGGVGITPQKDIGRNNAEFTVNRIYATPFETNIASHRVLEKAGFILETRLMKTVIKNEELLDELVYAIRK